MLASTVLPTPNKTHLRREMKARRLSLNESQKARASWQVTRALWNWLSAQPEWEAGATMGVYLARPFEVSLDGLIASLLKNGHCLGAPRVDVENEHIAFWHLDSLETVESGPWSVREPLATRQLTPEIVLVPGLAFDIFGNRLGTGGGWYDRLLTPEMIKIGVCFDCQIVPEVPCEATDRAMNFVVSPERFIRCAQL